MTSALTVSGLLIDEIGGRSAKPYQPAGLYRHLNFPRRTYTADTDKNQYRRGLYTHWQRQFLHPAMKTFDAPSREECTCERARSNTPLGALVLLNDPSYIEAARNFANRLLVETKFDNDKDKIDWLLKQALSRPAQDSEIEVLKALVESHRKQYAESPAEANELLAIGNSKPMDGVDPVELAAWTNVARTIMNLHEFIVRN